MEQITEKRVSDSATEQIQIVMPEHINGFDRLFGGRLVEWIDIVAGVVARRHSNCNVTTVAMDKLHFKAAAHVNDIIVLKGKITYAGSSSMEIRVDTFVEDIDGYKKPINHAYLVMVAIDENEKPMQVPKLIIESEQEKAEYQSALKRKELRAHRQSEFF